MQMVQECQQCGVNTRCRRRDFNEQTWSVLLTWGEVDTTAVDQPICDTCYGDLREILIDRADEFDAALKQPKSAQPQPRSRTVAAKKAAPATAASKKKVASAKPNKKTSRVA